MELDDLKHNIKEKLLEPGSRNKSEEDIAILLRRKTQSLTDKIRRNLWLELILSCIFGAACIVVAFSDQVWQWRIYCSIFIIFSIVFCILIIYLLNRINRLNNPSLPVKENLSSLLTILKLFTRRYQQVCIAVLPVCAVFCLALNYTIYRQSGYSLIPLESEWKFYLKLLGYFLLLSLVCYFMVKWYMKKMYGQYIQMLEKAIHELGAESR